MPKRDRKGPFKGKNSKAIFFGDTLYILIGRTNRRWEHRCYGHDQY